LASFRAREKDEAKNLVALELLSGPLSFGTFLSVVQRVAKLETGHPLAPYLSPFRPKKQGGRGVADDGLMGLLNLRNTLGHDLARLSEARARSILSTHDPESILANILASLEGILSRPLFLIEEQQLIRGQIRARRLWLMGESRDPEPEEITLTQGVYDPVRPYVAIGEKVLPLWPCLVWETLPEHQNYGLLLLDTVKDDRIICQSTDAIECEINTDAVQTLQEMCIGQPNPPEIVKVAGANFAELWREEKRLRLDAAERQEGAIPWEEFDSETLDWFAARLIGQTTKFARAVISEQLLDNRTRFSQDEIMQARLLFGKAYIVRQHLRRDVIDLRTFSLGLARWDQRHVECDNLLKCLRTAVDFFANHIGIQETTIDCLDQTSGSADYLAMRESIVNLFIHQDYRDSSAAAQIEMQKDRATFFNTGFSLVSKEKLVEGGKSQARNPLIARALRLIGFAELAGSGIRVLQAAWREARRRPPRFDSDRDANTFTLTLDWRQVADAYDAFWKNSIGVRLTTEQAEILNLALTTDGLSVEEAASGTGLYVDDAREALKHLVVQALLEERQGLYRVKDHLKELVQ
jgi:predicted HTH transcriptional regulator